MERLTGESVKLTRAPKHWGTAVFLDATGKQRIAALWANFGELIGWRLPDRDVSLSNVKEHATLSARASVDHGVDVETTDEHVNRAADRGCVSRLVLRSYLNEGRHENQY